MTQNWRIWCPIPTVSVTLDSRKYPAIAIGAGRPLWLTSPDRTST
jgi:hypothetical protein